MAALNLALVLDALARLDLELTRLERQTAHLGDTLRAANEWPALASVREVLTRAVVAMHELRDQIVDDLTTQSSTARREAALQARILVVTLQLGELQRAASTLPRGFWTSANRFRSAIDVALVINRELGRVNGAYIGDRKRLQRLEGDARENALLALLGRAEKAVDAVGADPSVACFLAAGASVSTERFRIACRVIAILLGVQLATTSEANPWRQRATQRPAQRDGVLSATTKAPTRRNDSAPRAPRRTATRSQKPARSIGGG